MNIKTLLGRLVRWLGLLPDEGIHYIGGSDTLPPPLTREEEAVLLERGRISEEELRLQMKRRLSAGTPAEAGAGWFEGLAKKNRYWRRRSGSPQYPAM